MRKTFKLNDGQLAQFKRLRPLQNEAHSFWKGIAKLEGLDPASIISNAPSFSGLPLGHGKPWCFPIPLKCVKRPVYRD